MPYRSIFSQTPSLFADQYAFTMASVDHAVDALERKSCSQVYFRGAINNGFKASDGQDLKIPYLVIAGLGPFFEWLDNWAFSEEDAAYFATLNDPKGQRLYPDAFLNHLRAMKLSVDIDAMPEGELAFPDEPVVRLWGPHYQVQMLEAALLNLVTSNTGWATIASQFWLAAQSRDRQAKLFEFGARRTPEWGGLGSSRSAYLAGWHGTSNLYAGQVYGIPAVGTMAHAFVMVRENELQAFEAWARHMPNLCVFLVDTYDSLKGVDNAIAVCRKTGHELSGIRLDSGDVDYLSRKAREKLNAAGFSKAIIMASDSLNVSAVHEILQVKQAPIDSFGIGGNYVGRRQDTSGVCAVMKTSRVQTRDVMKYSNAADKASFPGPVDVIRYLRQAANGAQKFAGDTIIPYGMDVGEACLSREIVSIPRSNLAGLKPFGQGTRFYRPVVPFVKAGAHLHEAFKTQNAPLILQQARSRFFDSLQKLDEDHLRILSPHLYGVGVEESLLERQRSEILSNLAAVRRRAADSKE